METENFKIWISVITGIIAMYGAILSTFNYLKSKKKIYFDFSHGFYYNPLTNQEYYVIIYKIVNTGRTPISVANIGIRIKGKKCGINQIIQQNVNLPKILTNEESITIPIESNEIKQALMKNGITGDIEIKGVMYDNANNKYLSEKWIKLTLK